MAFKKKKENNLKIGDLSKGVEKKYQKEKLAKKEKELGPTTTSALKFIRIIIWIFIILIIVAGIFQIVRSKQPRIIENIVKYDFSVVESPKAQALAKSFVREYLTYDDSLNNKNDSKLNQYIANSIKLKGRNNIINGSCKVLDVMVWNIEKIDDYHSNIIIKADVHMVNKNQTEQKYNSNGEVIKVFLEEDKTYYISVPIGADLDENVIVDDYPSFVSKPIIANKNIDTYEGETHISSTVKEHLKRTLEDFYKVFYSGTSGQIKYFFIDEDKQVEGLNGDFVFTSIQSIEAYETAKDVITAVVIVEVEQKDIGASFNQRHLFELQKINEKWLIKEMKNRGI